MSEPRKNIIKNYIQRKGETISEFAKSIDLHQSSLSRALNTVGDISDTLWSKMKDTVEEFSHEDGNSESKDEHILRRKNLARLELLEYMSLTEYRSIITHTINSLNSKLRGTLQIEKGVNDILKDQNTSPDVDDEIIENLSDFLNKNSESLAKIKEAALLLNKAERCLSPLLKKVDISLIYEPDNKAKDNKEVDELFDKLKSYAYELIQGSEYHELINVGTSKMNAWFKLTPKGITELIGDSNAKNTGTQFMHPDFRNGKVSQNEEFYEQHINKSFNKLLKRLELK